MAISPLKMLATFCLFFLSWLVYGFILPIDQRPNLALFVALTLPGSYLLTHILLHLIILGETFRDSKLGKRVLWGCGMLLDGLRVLLLCAVGGIVLFYLMPQFVAQVVVAPFDNPERKLAKYMGGTWQGATDTFACVILAMVCILAAWSYCIRPKRKA